MRTLYLWYKRTFCLLKEKEAIALKLRFYRNVFGDEINKLDCRSIWTDTNGNRYRVEELFTNLKQQE